MVAGCAWMAIHLLTRPATPTRVPASIFAFAAFLSSLTLYNFTK